MHACIGCALEVLPSLRTTLRDFNVVSFTTYNKSSLVFQLISFFNLTLGMNMNIIAFLFPASFFYLAQ